MRQQLDNVLQQKIANPTTELYTPHVTDPPPSSRLIQAIIDLITTEDYTRQVNVVAVMWFQLRNPIGCDYNIILWTNFALLRHSMYFTYYRLKDWQLESTFILHTELNFK